MAPQRCFLRDEILQLLHIFRCYYFLYMWYFFFIVFIFVRLSILWSEMAAGVEAAAGTAAGRSGSGRLGAPPCHAKQCPCMHIPGAEAVLGAQNMRKWTPTRSEGPEPGRGLEVKQRSG